MDSFVLVAKPGNPSSEAAYAELKELARQLPINFEVQWLDREHVMGGESERFLEFGSRVPVVLINGKEVDIWQAVDMFKKVISLEKLLGYYQERGDEINAERVARLINAEGFVPNFSR